MIGVATIVVEQNCDNCGWHCDNCGFLRQLWLVLRQLWLIATIVNIATIVITSQAPQLFAYCSSSTDTQKPTGKITVINKKDSMPYPNMKCIRSFFRPCPIVLLILGTCVQAPHSHSWGGYQYHNAAIIGLDTPNQKVRLCKIQNY